MVNPESSSPSTVTETAFPESVPIAVLSALKDPQARLGWLVDWARRLHPFPESLRRDEFRVSGCLVRLWWVPEFHSGRCWFRADSDAVSLKALTGFLASHYSGKTTAEILAGERAPLDRLGLLRHLADNRRATVLRVEELTHQFARTCQADAPSMK